MLIQDLRERGVKVPDFDPRAVAARYKAMPKERRKMVNALHRAGGTLPLSKLEASPAQLAGLREAGLVFVVEDRAVLPLELLFAVPLLDGERESLVEALRMYSRDGLWAIAAANGVAADGADEFTLRARLYRRAREGGALEGLDAECLKALERLREGEWTLRWEEYAGDAADSTGMEAQSVGFKKGPERPFLRMVVAPVRAWPGRSYFSEVTVPKELREGVAKLLAGGPLCRAGKPQEWRALDRSFRSDLLRYLLEVDRERPAITQRGGVNRRDLSRIAKRMEVEAELVESLNGTAVTWRLLSREEERAALTEEAESLLSLGPAAFDRALAERWRTFHPRLSGWLSPAAYERALEAVRRALLAAGRAACLPCVAGAAAADRAMKKALSGSRAPAARVASELASALAQGLRDFGFAEAAYEGERGVAIRWTAAGERAFATEPLPPAREERIVVQPTGEAIVPFGVPGAAMRMAALAGEVRSVDAVAVVALTRASVLRAAQAGIDPAAVKAVLEERSGGPLPQPVAFLLDEIAARMGEVEIVPCAMVLKVRDPAVLRSLGLEAVAPGVGIVPPTADPIAYLEKVRKAGWLFKLAGPPRPVPRAAEPEGEDEACVCETEARDPAGIAERIKHSVDTGFPIELVVRGGRRETMEVEGFDGIELSGWNVETGRNVSVAIGSIVSGRVLPPSEIPRR